MELSGNYRCQQIEINSYPDSPLFISTGFLPRVSSDPLYDYKAATTTTGPNPSKVPTDIGRCPATKYPCPVFTRNVTSRGVSYKCTKCYGWVHAKCYGILNAAQYRRKSDWTCDACSAPQSQQSPSPTRSFPLRLPNRSVMTARSTSYSSTLTDSGTS